MKKLLLFLFLPLFFVACSTDEPNDDFISDIEDDGLAAITSSEMIDGYKVTYYFKNPNHVGATKLRSSYITIDIPPSFKSIDRSSFTVGNDDKIYGTGYSDCGATITSSLEEDYYRITIKNLDDLKDISFSSVNYISFSCKAKFNTGITSGTEEIHITFYEREEECDSVLRIFFKQ